MAAAPGPVSSVGVLPSPGPASTASSSLATAPAVLPSDVSEKDLRAAMSKLLVGKDLVKRPEERLKGK